MAELINPLDEEITFWFHDSEHVPINTDGLDISIKAALFDYLPSAVTCT